MHVIWSRSAQTRSCQCISCIHASTTLTRRVMTGMSRSRLSANDAFTACYSAMFAGAALLDMKIKEDRRKQWDNAIAEAKVSSSAVPESHNNSALADAAYQFESGPSEPQDSLLFKAFQGPINRKPSADLNVHKQISITRVVSRRNSQSPPKGNGASLKRSLQLLSIKVRHAYICTNTRTKERGGFASQTGRNFLSETTVDKTSVEFSAKHKIKLNDREPRRQLHLERMQEMVWDLVTKLCKDIEFVSTATPEFLRHKIEKPEYTLTRAWLCEERKALDVVITTILENEVSNPSDMDLAVSKICYNLLISAAPPSILTYNTMLIYFTRLKAHHLAQIVVDSFFEVSYFRPNFTTVAAILDHYTAIGDKKGFNSLIQRMRGVRGHMRITRSALFENIDILRTRGWEPRLKGINRQGRLITKMPRNSLVFNSLILGSLRLFGLTRALTYFKAAIREGCHITGDLFDRVGQACLATQDTRAAVSLLSMMIPRWYLHDWEWGFESFSTSREIILQLLDMCGIKLWIDGKQSRTDESNDDIFHVLRSWLVALQTEVLDDYIKKSAETIKDLEMMIAVFTSGELANKQVLPGTLDIGDHRFLELTSSRKELGAIATAAQLVMQRFARSFEK